MRRMFCWAAVLGLFTAMIARAVSVDEIALASPIGMPMMAGCTATPTYITAAGSGTYTQPPNCNHIQAQVISSGGSSNGHGGGGGGGYADSGIVSLMGGTTIAFKINTGASADVWVCNSTANCANSSDSAVIASARNGVSGSSNTPGSGGFKIIGSVGYNGGNGTGNAALLGGGGGAAGPHGAGNNASSSTGGSGDAGFGGASAFNSPGGNGTEMGGGTGGGGGGSGTNNSTAPGGTCGGGAGAASVAISATVGCIKLTPSL